jgi:hypothetical protein
MPRKQLVQLASRALSLYLIFWAVGNLVNLPPLVYAISYYAIQPTTANRDFLYKFHVTQFLSHVVLSLGLLFAAVWTYRCGPKIETFLSPPES